MEEKEKKMAANACKHVVILKISVKTKTPKGLKDVRERRRDARRRWSTADVD